ncbi:MAG: hypothetical protein RR359_04870 [Bacilli bacterium]
MQKFLLSSLELKELNDKDKLSEYKIHKIKKVNDRVKYIVYEKNNIEYVARVLNEIHVEGVKWIKEFI